MESAIRGGNGAKEARVHEEGIHSVAQEVYKLQYKSHFCPVRAGDERSRSSAPLKTGRGSSHWRDDKAIHRSDQQRRRHVLEAISPNFWKYESDGVSYVSGSDRNYRQCVSHPCRGARRARGYDSDGVSARFRRILRSSTEWCSKYHCVPFRAATLPSCAPTTPRQVSHAK